MGEPGHTTICVGSVLCHQPAPGLSPCRAAVGSRHQPSPVVPVPYWGQGSCMERDCPESESIAFLQPNSDSSLDHSQFLQGVLGGSHSGQMDRWAGACCSLGQRKWLAGHRPVCRNCACAYSFSGPGRNSESVLPPLLTETEGCGCAGPRLGYPGPWGQCQ